MSDPAASSAKRAGAAASVAVLGSCITRDNFNSRFNPDYKRWFDVGATTNQSSMIALMSPPYEAAWEPLEPMPSYGVWNVNSDLSREILTLLAETPPDLLVLDFFGDVHFGVILTSDGRYVTDNRWKLHKTDLHQRIIDEPGARSIRWQDDEDAYFALWTEAMDRFADHVREHCPQTRVIVHHGFNAREVKRPGATAPQVMGRKGPEGRMQHERSNAFWRRLNEHASRAYGWASIDLTDEWYISFEEHPWGPFAVHYTMDYYHRFLAELHRQVLRHELPPALAERVDEIAEASAERVRAELAWWRSQHHEVEHARAQAGRDPLRRLRAAVRHRRTTPPPRPERPGHDHELLAALTADLAPEVAERIAALPRSADEHVAWLEELWTPWLAELRTR